MGLQGLSLASAVPPQNGRVDVAAASLPHDPAASEVAVAKAALRDGGDRPR